ncbi:MAG: branched-chain amino acid ABC transporter permease [Acidisphaera sp.]|nr:branched-chain amino acid ABC transporter permease [Acidisphaera sp.]
MASAREEAAGHAGGLGLSRSERVALAGLAALLVFGPFAIYPIFLMNALCFALFAAAYNLMIGYVGLMSFGHAAFFGMGSYVGGWTARYWHLDPLLAIAMGGATGLLMGTAFGWLALRRQGQAIYFATITLALAQMVYFVCVRATGFTGGEDGLQQVPRGRLLGLLSLTSDRAMYVVVAAIFLAGFLAIVRVVHSPFGQVLVAIRENEPRAVSLGYQTRHYKLIATIISCTLSGVAGAMQAIVFGIASLENVHFSMSGEVVLMTLTGGMGTLLGPVVGGFLVTAMENYLAPLGNWVNVLQGIVFVACVLTFRRGIVGVLGARTGWRL